jgi:DNA adenine methylase
MARPVLKWVGGKRRLIDEIIQLFPSDYKERAYHEPFFGGGALFFHLEPLAGSINDVNKRLMNFYKVLRDRPHELIDEASKLVYDKHEYYRLRARFNKMNLGEVEEAAILLYLNRTGYNGLYRVNSKGEYNVPFGRYKNPTLVDRERILNASKLLKKIIINSDRFDSVKKYANNGDLVYLDPPYFPISDTSDFTSYSKSGFNYHDHINLRDLCIELNDNSVFFVLSNSYTEPIIELYEDIKDFGIKKVTMNRAINSKPSKRGEVSEILVTNIPCTL